MSNPENDLDDTQPLSQSVYATFVSKSKSILGSEVRVVDLAPGVENNSLQEQESGHVDILRGFKDGALDEHDGEDDTTSEVYNFSPTQTQAPLPRLQESQRFKTPATAGKKRDFLGQTVDRTPANHNPFASASKSPAPMMGLSQLFQTTQAISSPLMNLRSDPSERPSPNLDVNDRPATATSPLVSIKPLTRFQRATTEPSATYVSMKLSQAERGRDLNRDEERKEDQSDDGFDEEPSLVERLRRERERDQRVKEQLAAIKAMRRVQEKPDITSPILVRDNNSEEETDYEDMSVQKPERKTRRTESEEDKENIEMPIQVPRTTAKLQEAFFVSDSSPLSTRNTRQPSDDVSHSQPPLERRGIGSFAIADSQRSENDNEGKAIRRPSQRAPSSAADEIVPQSQPQYQTDAERAPEQRRGAVNEAMDGVEGAHGSLTQNEVEPEAVNGASPTTNRDHDQPNRQNEGGDDIDHRPAEEASPTLVQEQQPSGSSQGRSANNEQSETSTKFHTAPSELPVNHSSKSSTQRSVQSPVERPMKRMLSIVEEPSPQKSSGNVDFVPDILTADDRQFMQTLEASSPPSSPIRAGRRLKRRRIMDSSPTSSPFKNKGRAAPTDPAFDAELSPTTQRTSANTGRPRSTMNRTPVSENSGAGGVWDLPESPQKQPPTIHKRRRGSPKQQVEEVGPSSSSPNTTVAEKAASQPDPGRDDIPQVQSVEQEGTEPASMENPCVPMADSTTILRPNQIFACFNGKSRAYYPARCLAVANTDPLRYSIQWEGFSPDELDAHGIRRLEVQIGDAVKVGLEGFPKVSYTVKGLKDRVMGASEDVMTDIFGHKTVLVAPKQRKSLPADLSSERSVEVPISSIYLDSNMWSQLKGRELSFALPTHQTAALSSGFATPTDRPSTPSSPPSRTRQAPTTTQRAPETGLFSNMLFAISVDEPTKKNRLVDLIRAHAGTILEDGFDELFFDQAESSSDATTLTLNPLYQHSTIKFTALITPDFSRKTKYMQSLSLNIPCLSPSFVDHCIASSTTLPYDPYLLAAGKSLFLDGATKSRVLNLPPPPSPSESYGLAETVAARPTPLKGEHVVFVMGKTKVDERRRPYLFLIRAMGAASVERVFDVKAAKELVATSAEVDDADGKGRWWMVVDDKDLDAAKAVVNSGGGHSAKRKSVSRADGRTRGKSEKATQARVVGTDFIAQSLILGALPFDRDLE